MSGVVHGGVTDAELEAYAARGIELVDLSASLNPYGPHPRVAAAAREAALDRYPEPDARTLRAAYAADQGLAVSNVAAGNGSSELLYLAVRAFATPGRPALVAGPTFGEYARAAHAAGADAIEIRAEAERCFGQDVSALVAAIEAHRPALMVVCNPNNPTGALLSRREIEHLTRAAADVGGRVLVDEAYGDFAHPRDERSGPAPGRLVVRSLTKLHAMPGLRLGFLLGGPADVEAVRELQPPWTVSAPAMAAGLQALREKDFAAESRRHIASARAAMLAALASRGFPASESHANFVVVGVAEAACFRTRLMERGFVVRDCTSFGLPRHVRIAVPREDQVGELVAAMEASR